MSRDQTPLLGLFPQKMNPQQGQKEVKERPLAEVGHSLGLVDLGEPQGLKQSQFFHHTLDRALQASFYAGHLHKNQWNQGVWLNTA